MGRKKSNYIVTSLSFEKEIFERLEQRCKTIKMPVSTFINLLAKKAVMSEYEFLITKAKYYAAKLNKYQYLADRADDKPIEVVKEQ